MTNGSTTHTPSNTTEPPEVNTEEWVCAIRNAAALRQALATAPRLSCGWKTNPEGKTSASVCSVFSESGRSPGRKSRAQAPSPKPDPSRLTAATRL